MLIGVNNSSLNKFPILKYEIIETVTQNVNTSANMKIADYPDGFTYDNCYVLAYKLALNNEESTWFSDGALGNFSIYLDERGIYQYLDNSSYSNKAIKIVLCKFE